MIIAPSILSANFNELQKEIESVEPYCEWLQIDVMDGHFVPNLSFGAPVIKNIKTKLLIDVHLMVANPADRVEEFLKVGAKNISFHAEAVHATEDRIGLIKKIHDGGSMAGIALNPETPAEAVLDVIDAVDLVLIMSVNPGFGGQSFIGDVLKKIPIFTKARKEIALQIDGGINADTAKLAREAGIKNIVAGNFIFAAADRKTAIESLRG